MSGGPYSSQGSRREPLLPFLPSGCQKSLMFFDLQLCHSYFCLHFHLVIFLFCISLCLSLFFLKKILVIEFGAPTNRELSSFNLTALVKTLFPNIITFRDNQGLEPEYVFTGTQLNMLHLLQFIILSPHTALSLHSSML